MVRSCPALAFSCETAAGSKSRSIRVLALHGLERRGVHDLVGRLPDPREVPNVIRLVGDGVRRLPVGHHLVHAAPKEVGADRPLELVDDGMHLVVGFGPVEVAVVVGDVAVERRDRRVNQPPHV